MAVTNAELKKILVAEFAALNKRLDELAPAPAPAPAPAAPSLGAFGLAINLPGITTWNGHQPFADLVHSTDRMWERPGWWHDKPMAQPEWFDADGYPVAMPPDSVLELCLWVDVDKRRGQRVRGGSYCIRINGNVEATPIAGTSVQNIRTRPNEVLFDIPNPDACSAFYLRLHNKTANPGAARPQVFHESDRASIDAGDPLSLAWVEFYRAHPRLVFLRLLDVLSVNNSEIRGPEDIATEDQRSWCKPRIGMPPTMIGRMAKAIGCPMWVPTPHMANMEAKRTWFKDAALHYPAALPVIAQDGNEGWGFHFKHFNFYAIEKSKDVQVVDERGQSLAWGVAPDNRRAGSGMALGMLETWTAAEEAFGKRVIKVGDGHPEWHDLMASWTMTSHPAYFGGKRAGDVADAIPTTMYWAARGLGTMQQLLEVDAGAQPDQWWIDAHIKDIDRAVAKRNETMAAYKAQGINKPYIGYEGVSPHDDDFGSRTADGVLLSDAFPAQYQRINEKLYTLCRSDAYVPVVKHGVEACRSLGMQCAPLFVSVGEHWKAPARQITPFGVFRQSIYEPDTAAYAYLRGLK